MKIKLVIPAILTMLTMLASSATADFVTTTRAYEVGLAGLSVPPSQHSRLMFRQCPDCDSESIRLTPQTRFIVNGRSVSLDRFRHATKQAITAAVVSVTVLHHLKSDTIESVSLNFK